ncbi:VCBS repeat-containing protein [Bradyrhizobium sp. GM5.1]
MQYLGAGQTKTDTFTITSLDGVQKQISFNVHGTNDAAVIGVPTQRDVTEDTTAPNLSVTGSISISDADQGQAAFKTTVTSAAGNLGGLVLAANGTYTYSVSNAATQYLGAGDTKVDTFTVASLDGTTKQVSFTIHGINDAAVIGTPTAHDVTEDATNPILYAAGTVSIVDADQGESAFQPTIQAGNGNLGVLVMGSNGAYVYAALDSAVQYLGAGDTKVDTFTLTALDGTQKQVTFTIHGTNDAAVIGAPVVHDVTEDVGVSAAGNLTAAGVLSIADADQNQSSFQTVAVAAAAGTLGHLSIAANGAYSYTVADSAVQYLGANDVKTETFTVTAFDGTQKQVSFTIHGANDAAVIGTPVQHDVTKNASPVTLTASGILFISDADQNQSAFKTTVASASSNLGHLSIAADGTYTYSVANSATQYLGAADVKVETFTVTSLDGTQKQISFTIHGGSGASTPATIGNPDHILVREDGAVSPAGDLTTSGNISITDPDAGQAAFQTVVTPGAGNLGTLVLQSDGTYTYSVANSAVQYLGAGDLRVESFTIKSIDGTSKVVSFTIQGMNDTAVIGDPVTHTVTEDSGGATLSATGQLTIADVDQYQLSFKPGSVADANNLGSLSFAVDGTYTYSVANSAVQYLGANDTRTDTFTVHSVDGTPKVISFTIQGHQRRRRHRRPGASRRHRRRGIVVGLGPDDGDRRRRRPVAVQHHGDRPRRHPRSDDHHLRRPLHLHGRQCAGAGPGRRRGQGRNLHRFLGRRHHEAGLLHHPRHPGRTFSRRPPRFRHRRCPDRARHRHPSGRRRRRAEHHHDQGHSGQLQARPRHRVRGRALGGRRGRTLAISISFRCRERISRASPSRSPLPRSRAAIRPSRPRR